MEIASPARPLTPSVYNVHKSFSVLDVRKDTSPQVVLVSHAAVATLTVLTVIVLTVFLVLRATSWRVLAVVLPVTNWMRAVLNANLPSTALNACRRGTLMRESVPSVLNSTKNA